MDDDWPVAGTLLAFRYRLVTRLEIGGMAEIWHAEDELLGRPVALKLPTDLTTPSAEVLHLAWKEARTAARLSHPNIAAVHDYREAIRPDGSVAPFVVMELLTGETLAARLERSPLTWPEAAGITQAVAEALAAAHAGGVVHRDIKPGNVMLTPVGIKILDFGISAATGEPDDDETGATFGTPAYVSPERLDGKPAEPATDVYGLGVLLYEMVTGQPPYPVDTWEELAAARVTRPADLPSALPAAFRDLVRRCLDDDPARRPTAVDVRQRLAALMPADGAAGEADGPEPAPAGTGTVGRPARRRLVIRLGIVAAAVAIGAVFVTIGSSYRTDNAEPAPPAVPLVTTPPATPASPAPSSSALTSPPLAPPPPSSPTPASPAVPSASGPGSAPPSVPPATLGFADAVSRVRSAVEAGQAGGQIRPDVATDLLNLIQPLSHADAENVDVRVNDLQRKIRDRVSDGGVDEAQAVILESRLADLGRAVGA